MAAAFANDIRIVCSAGSDSICEEICGILGLPPSHVTKLSNDADGETKLNSDCGQRARTRRVRHPVDMLAGQHQHHRSAPHPERVAASLVRTPHGRRAVLRVLPADEEDQEPGARLGGRT